MRDHERAAINCTLIRLKKHMSDITERLSYCDANERPVLEVSKLRLENEITALGRQLADLDR